MTCHGRRSLRLQARHLTVEKASDREGLGAGNLVAYAIQKVSGKDQAGAGKLVGYTVLSSGIVLAWRHGADLDLRTSAALAAATALASAPAFAFDAAAEFSAGGAQSTNENVLALIPLVL